MEQNELKKVRELVEEITDNRWDIETAYRDNALFIRQLCRPGVGETVIEEVVLRKNDGGIAYEVNKNDASSLHGVMYTIGDVIDFLYHRGILNVMRQYRYLVRTYPELWGEHEFCKFCGCDHNQCKCVDGDHRHSISLVHQA